MSTKIHHGYLVSLAGRSLFDAHAVAASAIDVAYQHTYRDLVVGLAAGFVDAATIGHDPTVLVPAAVADHPAAELPAGTGSPLLRSVFLADALQREVTTSGRRNPTFDLGCELVWLPHPDRTDAVLVLGYTEQAHYLEAFAALDGVSWYGYWNNTDAPDDCAADEWADRARVWDAAVGSDAPARRGLTWSLLGDQHHADVVSADVDLVAHVPEPIVRALPFARRELDRRVAAGEFGEITSPADIMRIDRDRLVEARDALAAGIADRLGPLTRDDLTAGL